MPDYYAVLTNAGLAAIANAALTESSVEITEVAVGSGEGLPVQSLTALRDEVWRGPVTRLARSPSDPTVIQCETRIPPDEGGWIVREIGMFDADGTLIAIGNLPDSYKPVLESGSTKDMLLRMYIQNSNADVVTVKIDPAIIMASQAFVYSLMAEQSLRSSAAMMVALTEQLHRNNFTQTFEGV